MFVAIYWQRYKFIIFIWRISIYGIDIDNPSELHKIPVDCYLHLQTEINKVFKMFNKAALVGAMVRRSFGTTQLMRQTIKNHEPNNLERRMLVWSGKYKSQAEVPSFVRWERAYILTATGCYQT